MTWLGLTAGEWYGAAILGVLMVALAVAINLARGIPRMRPEVTPYRLDDELAHRRRSEDEPPQAISHRQGRKN